jgi:hypothetical protein
MHPILFRIKNRTSINLCNINNTLHEAPEGALRAFSREGMERNGMEVGRALKRLFITISCLVKYRLATVNTPC